MPADASYARLELERDGPLLRVWLARPERRNALDTLALEEIARLFEGLATAWDVRCVVLGGRGPSFCAGADRRDPPGSARMRRSAGASARERRRAAQLGRRACLAIERAEVPTVARLHGHAVGGGLALALACDFRVASEDTVFHVPEVDLGIPLLWGAAPRLVHEVGAARAREIILLCDRLDAPTAARWNVVHRVVAAARLDAEVDGMARRLAAKPEIAVHMTKTQMRALAATTRLGDVSEADGDLLLEASREGVAREAFRLAEGSDGED
jgi:enoyl-CoA hydratase/carnithine racemase